MLKTQLADWHMFIKKRRKNDEKKDSLSAYRLVVSSESDNNFLNQITFRESSTKGKFNLFRNGAGKITDE